METKTDIKTPLVELVERLGAAPNGQADRWLGYYRDWNNSFASDAIIPKSIDPKEINSNEYLSRVHMGLILYEGSGHPLYAQLSTDEREAMEVARKAMVRVFKNQKEAGLYDKFYQRVAAAR